MSRSPRPTLAALVRLARRAAARARAVKLASLWARRRQIARVSAIVVAAPFVLVGVMALLTPLPGELAETPAPSVRVLSRDGRLLREVRADDGTRARPLPLAAFPKHVTDAVLAAEDRRFYAHFGVDPVAVTRALLSNLWHRRVVSGASTLTMQLARTVRPHPRTLWGKLGEAALALRIEASVPKDRILEAYLNRVAYGPNMRGYAAASHAYFSKPPDALSLAEAALIAGLPRGPSLYDVTKRPERAQRRRDRVLARLSGRPIIPASAAASRCWTFSSWDHFVVPFPFARCVVYVGDRVTVPRRASPEVVSALREKIQGEMRLLTDAADAHFGARERAPSLSAEGP